MDILGTESTETLFGTESSDNIFGFAGLDTLQALGGDDAIFGNQDNDWIDCGQGFDTVYGGKNDDFILGGFDDDYLRGDLESDEIHGEDGEDSLFGGKFPDTLIGGNGNDNLYGDLGSDILTGGEGADFFWLRPEGEGTDEITDYQDGVDSLMLPDDLTFNDLIIQPGNGNQTIISIANTGEQLVILENVSSDNVTEADFGAIISQTEESTISFSNAVDLGNLDGTQTQSDAVGDNNPINFYRFTLDAPKDLNLQLQGLSADADLYLIEDVNGNNLFDQGLDTSEVIDSSVLSGNEPESINFTQLATGTYFVGVSQFEGETNYDLTLTATGFTARSDGAGDTPEAALNIGVLQAEQTFQDFVGSSDANDYYKFTLNGISDFNLSLENLSADADVKLTDSTGNEIDFSANAGNNSETIQSLGLQAGDYYLQVYSFTGDTDYNLIVSADPVVVIPPDLAGNTREDAKDVGTLSTEQIFNDFVGNVDADDYYKFTLDKNADFQLKLDQLTANADVELLDEQGQLIESSANADDQSETITQGLNAGTYFVHVLQKEGDSNYQLSLSAAEQLPPPDPGSTLETAVEQDSPVFSINGTVSGDKPDHFVKFTVNESGIFTANLSGLTADADVRLIADYNNDGQINPVEDRNGNQFVDDQEIEVLGWLPERNTNNESIRAFVQPGTYYLEVDSVDQQATNYTVDTTFNPSASDPLAFDIQFNYKDGTAGLSPEFRTGLEQAAQTWERIIPYSSFGGSHTLTIDVYGQSLEQNFLAMASYGKLSAQYLNPGEDIVKDLKGNLMPMTGYVTINTSPEMQSYFKNDSQAIPRVLIHEFGHVLGLVGGFENITSLDDLKDSRKFFNKQKGTQYNPNTYAGIAYGELTRNNSPLGIPIETSTGREGSDYSHWEESKFDTEIMTYQDELNKPRPISQFTIASLRDSGWNVNYGAAEPFSLS